MKNWDKNDKIMDRNGAFAAIRHLSFGIFISLFCLVNTANSFAQSSNRWLLVFNTSTAMRDRTNGVLTVAQDLLASGMHGTIRPGDTIGIWTYNSALRADEAPLQTWSPNTANSIAYNTLKFLSLHPYEKTAAFGDVLTNMLRVVKMSDVITVILISDGADSVKGTPFDTQIENYYKTNYQPQKKARMPVVTVLRGEKGVITTNTLALAPWPVDIPATPPPPIAKATVQKPAPAAPAKPVPSLVIIGKKAETMINVPTDLPDHSGEPPQQPVIAPLQAEAVPVAAQTETPPPAPAPVTAPAPKAEEKPAPTLVVAATPTPAPAAAEPPKPAQPAEPQPKTATEWSQPPVTKTAAPPAAETIAAVPASSLFSARNIAIVSVIFTLLVCALLILTARNARRATRASLITRSLDRERN